MGVIHSSKEILGGIPVFEGTRVPVRTLIEYLEEGDSIDEFLEDFPTVTKEKVLAFLERVKEELLRSWA